MNVYMHGCLKDSFCSNLVQAPLRGFYESVLGGLLVLYNCKSLLLCQFIVTFGSMLHYGAKQYGW